MSGIINSAGSKSGVIGTTELEYEEGTFTPTLSSGTRAGMGVSGYYTRTGRIVHVSIRFGDINSSSASAYSASSDQDIGNLPFTASSTENGGGLTTVYDIRIGWTTAGAQLNWRIDANTNYAVGHWFDSGVGSDTIQSEWTTGGSSIYLTGTYII